MTPSSTMFQYDCLQTGTTEVTRGQFEYDAVEPKGRAEKQHPPELCERTSKSGAASESDYRATRGDIAKNFAAAVGGPSTFGLRC